MAGEVHTDFWVLAGTTGPVLVIAHLVAVEHGRRVIFDLVPQGAAWRWKTVLRHSRFQDIVAAVLLTALLVAGVVCASIASLTALDALGSPVVNDANLDATVKQLKFSLLLLTIQGILPLVYSLISEGIEWLDKRTGSDHIIERKLKLRLAGDDQKTEATKQEPP